MPATPELWRDLGQVNNTDSGAGGDDQFDPKVIHLTNGNIVIAWTSNTNVGAGSDPGTDIIGEIYDSRGNLVRSEFRLNSGSFSTDERDFDLAALPSGGFVVAYIDDNGGNDTDVLLSEWNAAGTSVISRQIALDGGDSQTYRNPNVEVLSNASVLVTYENVNPDADANGGDVNVEARVYNSSTNTVNAGTNTFFTGNEAAGEGISGNNIAALTNNTYAVVYGNNNPAPSDDTIQVQLMNAAGGNIGFGIVVSGGGDFQQDPHIVGLTGGGFVVVWTLDGTDFSGNSGVRGRVYDNAGNAQTGIFTPATTVAGNQNNAAVAALADGGFVIAWVDAETLDIHGQRYNAAGNQVGTEFNIDTNIGAGAFFPPSGLDIEGLDDGRFVVTWEEGFPTGGLFQADFDVRARIYDPRDMENSPNDYTTDQVVGTIGADSIDVVSSDDQVYGWNGNDRLNFNSAFDTLGADIYDGGSGTDTIEIQGNTNVSFVGDTIVSIEEVEFAAGAGETKTATFDAADVGGGGLSSSLLVDGNSNGAGAPDTLRFVMGADTNLSLAGFTFQDWTEFDMVVVDGDGSFETITGSSVNDRLNGFAGNDTLNGGDGDDILDGGDDADIMSGGDGNDVYLFDNAGDRIIETGALTGGFDSVLSLQTVNLTNSTIFTGRIEASTLFGNADANLIGNIVSNILTGNDGSNVINGQAGADNMRGRGGSDIYVVDDAGDIIDESLPGSSGFDRILSSVSINLSNTAQIMGGLERVELTGAANVNAIGNLLINSIVGNSGSNIINGLAGNDILTGGAGFDAFVFTTAPGAGNVDTITDYNVINDRIWLDDAMFGSLGPTVAANEFRVFGTGPQDANDFLLYNPANGALFYDADGNGAGAAQLFAVVSAGLAMNAGDFLIV